MKINKLTLLTSIIIPNIAHSATTGTIYSSSLKSNTTDTGSSYSVTEEDLQKAMKKYCIPVNQFNCQPDKLAHWDGEKCICNEESAIWNPESRECYKCTQGTYFNGSKCLPCNSDTYTSWSASCGTVTRTKTSYCSIVGSKSATDNATTTTQTTTLGCPTGQQCVNGTCKTACSAGQYFNGTSCQNCSTGTYSTDGTSCKTCGKLHVFGYNKKPETTLLPIGTYNISNCYDPSNGRSSSARYCATDYGQYTLEKFDQFQITCDSKTGVLRSNAICNCSKSTYSFQDGTTVSKPGTYTIQGYDACQNMTDGRGNYSDSYLEQLRAQCSAQSYSGGTYEVICNTQTCKLEASLISQESSGNNGSTGTSCSTGYVSVYGYTTNSFNNSVQLSFGTYRIYNCVRTNSMTQWECTINGKTVAADGWNDEFELYCNGNEIYWRIIKN